MKMSALLRKISSTVYGLPPGMALQNSITTMGGLPILGLHIKMALKLNSAMCFAFLRIAREGNGLVPAQGFIYLIRKNSRWSIALR